MLLEETDTTDGTESRTAAEKQRRSDAYQQRRGQQSQPAQPPQQQQQQQQQERQRHRASPQDIRDALQRAQSALATMRARNHAGASGRWCRCDTARLHFFHNKALPLIQRGQLDEMSEHWPMLEGPKDVTGEAKVGFDAWAVKHYTRPRAGAAAVTEDPTELKRLLDCALEVAHAHTLPQIPRGRPPSERSEYLSLIHI